jgi:hypothetical protein
MAKQRPSLEAFAQTGDAIQHQQEPAAPAPASKVVELIQPTPAPTPAAPPPPAAAKARREREHTSLYLNKKVLRAIKEIALQYDRKPHDLYLEGINLMLAQYGKPSIEDLSRE